MKADSEEKEKTKSSVDDLSEKNTNIRLEEQIKVKHLHQLMEAFQMHEPEDIIIKKGTGYFPPKITKRKPGCMNIEEFKNIVTKVLGTDEYEEYLEKLFTKLDTASDGYVDWNEFCSYMLLLYRENDYVLTKKEIPFLAEPKIKHIVQNRQEPSTKIIAIDNPARFVTVSKESAMSVWLPNMQFEKSFSLSENDEEPTGQKRRFKMWVTDAIYMLNSHKIAISSTSRDIRFFDVSTNHFFEEFHLYGIPDVPYCFDYHFNQKNPNGVSILLFGVDSGAVHLLCFQKPVTQLFEMEFKSDGGVQKIYMQDLIQHRKWVHHSVIDEVHSDLIRQVMYVPDNDLIISCCGSSNKSMVISDIYGLKKSYVFKLDKGIECFDFNKKLNTLATGSADHLLRLWNPYVPGKPVAVFQGHVTGVIAVKIDEKLLQVFSYSKDVVVKAWDIKEHTCLQTIVLKFPSSIHGHMPEHGQFPMHLQHSPQRALLVTCNDYISILRLGQSNMANHNTEETHDTQLCSAIYNPFFKQAVTGCDSSTVAVWDIETGSKSMTFSNAHGGEEITCMTFDYTWRWLITGARNGTIKVWNFQNGHNLQCLEPVAEAEVTGVMPLADRNIILAVGWSRLITSYDNSDPDNMYLKATTAWKGGQLHQDDILSIDFCPPNFLATSSFDGEIIVWNLETEKIFVRLNKGSPTNIFRRIESMQTKSNNATPMNSRPNSRHRKIHKVPKGQVAPVDKLLFLKARANVKNPDSAILVSSGGGWLQWWCLYGAKNELGCFYVPELADESVLGVCTGPDNNMLVTGDTQGIVQVWKISDYCVKSQEVRVETKPPLEAIWQAHDSAIVSVDFVSHPLGDFILTASTDRTARLWNISGHYIGTLGQKSLWDLTNPSTWAHPESPWTLQPKDVSAVEGDSLSMEETESKRVNSSHTYVKELTNEKLVLPSVTESKMTDITDIRSSVETCLGHKAEKELARKKQDRHDRWKILEKSVSNRHHVLENSVRPIRHSSLQKSLKWNFPKIFLSHNG
ncbi:hypothetical protein ScPMuIL_003566 [Solemya velum]